jgi:hypothetical protein
MIYYKKNNLTMRDDPFVYANGIQGVARTVLDHSEHWPLLLSQGATVTVTMSANGSATHLEELKNNISSGYVASSLTGWGPSWELNMTS